MVHRKWLREFPAHEIFVDAAIFADGVAIGDSKAIKSLWDRREWLAVGFGEVFHDLDTSVPEASDKDGMIETLTQIEQTKSGPNTPREERNSIATAYETVIGNIRNSDPESVTKLIATLREQANRRIKAIQSQVAPFR